MEHRQPERHAELHLGYLGEHRMSRRQTAVENAVVELRIRGLKIIHIVEDAVRITPAEPLGDVHVESDEGVEHSKSPLLCRRG